MKWLLFNFFTTVVLIFNIASVRAQVNPKLYLIGDSTCSYYTASAYPKNGWGMTISNYFDNNSIKFNNHALSGRSSKSFYDEGSWTPVLNSIASGDFLVIQFGHNDEIISNLQLGSDPYTTYQVYLTKYIDEARAKGAYPILVTSIYRNYWKNDVLIDSHGDYPPAMRALAIQKNVPLVDAATLTKTLFELLGQTFTTKNIFLNLLPSEYPNYPTGNSDNTHLQEKGALIVGNLIANELSRLSQSYSYLSVFKNALLGQPDFSINNQKINFEVLNEQIKISSDSMIDQLIIIDVSGRVILQKEQSFNNMEIIISSWSNGIYFAKFYSSGKNTSHKFILLK